ncbi:hypothetical protein AAFX60_018715 [Aliivibrio fischeri]
MEELMWGLGGLGIMLLMFVGLPCWLAKTTPYKPTKTKSDNDD